MFWIYTLHFTQALTKAFVNKKELSYSDHTHDDRYYTETEISNLLSGKANTSHTHSASQITSGTLSVARGGTGVTSLDALKSAMGISSNQYKILSGIQRTTNGQGAVTSRLRTGIN